MIRFRVKIVRKTGPLIIGTMIYRYATPGTSFSSTDSWVYTKLNNKGNIIYYRYYIDNKIGQTDLIAALATDIEDYKAGKIVEVGPYENKSDI